MIPKPKITRKDLERLARVTGYRVVSIDMGANPDAKNLEDLDQIVELCKALAERLRDKESQ